MLLLIEGDIWYPEVPWCNSLDLAMSFNLGCREMPAKGVNSGITGSGGGIT